MFTILMVYYVTCTHASAANITGQKICETKGCKEAAKAILASMDNSIKPCHNFYHFACGNYLKKAVIPKGQTMISYYETVWLKMEEQLKSALEGDIKPSEPKAFKILQSYYKSCMDEALIEKNSENDIKEVLKGYGGWPVLEGQAWTEANFDWKKTLYRLTEIGDTASHFVYLSIDADRNNSTRKTIYVEQPEFNIDVEYLKESADSKVLQAYVKYMNQLAVLLGANSDQSKRELADVFNFERELAKICIASQDRIDELNPFVKVRIQELQNKYKNFPWLEYINGLFKTNPPINNKYEVFARDKRYFEKFVALLSKTPKRVLANYIMWRVAFGLGVLGSKRLQGIWYEFQSAYVGSTSSLERWIFCLRQMEDLLKPGLGSMFVRRFYNQSSKNEASAMLHDIRGVFNDMLKQVDWMDAQTKKYAIEKHQSTIEFVAFPSELLNNNKIDDYYKGLSVNSKSFMKTHLSIKKINAAKDLASLQKPTNKSDWTNHAEVAVVNAYHSDWENSINLPAGILQGVFFSPDRPKYLNYASMATTMGHEITHGFDDGGSNFDKYGNVKNWWNPTTRKRFDEKAGCIKKQYSNFTVKEVNMNISGNLTARENIADNGGYREAYLAYVKWEKKNGPEPVLKDLPYTPRQLFWLYSATVSCSKNTPERIKRLLLTDEHSPDEARVNGPLSNIVQFSEDFNCLSNSAMNSPKKCIVW